MSDKPGVFKKGDPRINRKGRPKDFTGLRSLAQMIATEKGATDKDGKPHSNVEMLLRELMRENPEKFLEIAFGKVPQPVEHSGGDKPIEIVFVDETKPLPSDNPST